MEGHTIKHAICVYNDTPSMCPVAFCNSSEHFVWFFNTVQQTFTDVYQNAFFPCTSYHTIIYRVISSYHTIIYLISSYTIIYHVISSYHTTIYRIIYHNISHHITILYQIGSQWCHVILVILDAHAVKLYYLQHTRAVADLRV